MNEFDFLSIKEMQRIFCTCDLSLGNYHACDNHTPKMPVIENKACAKLMACVGACICDRTSLVPRLEIE